MSGRANFEETMAKELAKLAELNEGLPSLPDDLLKQLDDVKKAYVDTVNAHEKVYTDLYLNDMNRYFHQKEKD